MRTRPLPIRVEPFDDESWNGYLARVAAAYRIPLSEVHARLGLTRSRAASAANQGLALTDATLHRYSEVLSLEPARVSCMLLQRFDGTALQFGEDDVRHLDPTDQFRLRYLDTTYLRIGWLHARPFGKWCSRCLAANPSRWQLSWRLPWHVYCERHDRLLSIIGKSVHEQSAVAAGTVAAQCRLLDIAYGRVRPPRPSAVQFVRDVQAAAETLLNDRGARISGVPPEPQLLAQVLTDAVAAATSPAGRPSPGIDTVLQHESGRAAASAALRRHDCTDRRWLRGRVSDHGIAAGWRGLPMDVCHVPSEHRLPDAPRGSIRWIPQMMPMDIFAGALSDLLYPTRIARGRHDSAVAAYMLAADTDYRSACYALGGSGRKSPEFAALMRRLQFEGRDDAFWLAVHHTVDELRLSGIDYVERAAWLDDGGGIRDAAKLAGVPAKEPTLGLWFRCEWAKLRPRGPDELGTQAAVERLDQFAERYGDALADAAASLLTQAADHELAG